MKILQKRCNNYNKCYNNFQSFRQGFAITWHKKYCESFEKYYDDSYKDVMIECDFNYL